MSSRILSEKDISGLLASLADHEHYVLLDTSKPDSENSQSLLFTEPRSRIIYRFGEDRQDFLDRLQEILEAGFYLAGWFGYEFLQDIRCLQGKVGAEFGVYSEPLRFDRDTPPGDLQELQAHQDTPGEYRIENLRPNMDQDEYCRAIETILDYIAAGDTYQVNYTFKLFFDFHGSVASFYRDLRHSQPVPYGACIRSNDHHVLSFSPELFFRAEGERIIARPMKGTLKRGRTQQEDRSHATDLYGDTKNRSENVMIVDLLRNDLSRLADATGGGRVHVESLFDIERYRSVFQMTSTVVARRTGTSGITPREIVEAIFPCGSVTGAPKIRTMEIIDDLEKAPRGVYCGAIGYFSPDQAAVFNVPIRTVVIDRESGEMGIGSGIVADSSPIGEWQECLLKSKFLTDPLPRFEIIETLFYETGEGFFLLEEHLDRLAGSADYFSFTFDRELAASRLLESVQSPDGGGGGLRVRLTLSCDGDLEIATAPCTRPATRLLPPPGRATGTREQIELSTEQLHSSSPWLFHKTTMRQTYNLAHDKARQDGLFDIVFSNEKGEITEGCISNIFVLLDGVYYTPPQHCGLLDGVMRRHILDNQRNPVIREKKLLLSDLLGAEAIYCTNSVRGVVPVELRQFPG
jgi:para-aminobenzoate synthetase/4-amino-4-deoxychorismate lyase